ncbi:MAG: chemotaxis response regulator protein-glutamate methylesterase [Myxococcota bacterium]
MAKLRVLVIDDSAFNRQTIVEMLESHAEIEVVGKAFDGEEGLKLATQLEPDMITLDIEMPRMDGFTFLRILMSRLPTPVIVISSHSRKEEVFQALELGALDFIAKPDHHIGPDLNAIREELLSKTLVVRSLRKVVVAGAAERRKEIRAEVAKFPAPSPTTGKEAVERIVCLGASTGGPPALELIFKFLPPTPTTAYLVAQHMPEKFTRAFAERLDRMSTLNIVEAEGGAPIVGGRAFVAPGGSHMEIEPDGDRGWRVRLLTGTEGDRYIPSIDALFESAAASFPGSVMAVILTGMGSDGRAGIEAVHAAGGHTVAESEASAVVFGMPKEAIRSGCVDDVMALSAIVGEVLRFAAVIPS